MASPNFLVVMTDQQRADHLGCAGHPALQTPNLDRLAAQGVRLNRAYVNNPVCMPSRSTLLTGQTPRGHGVRTNGINLDPAVPTMTEALRRAGYRTHAVGKIHVNIYGLPNDADAQALDPAGFPESAWMWSRRRVGHLPLPYYGFQTAEITIGHGPGVGGDYRNWLEAAHPEAVPLMRMEAAERPVSGAEQSAILNLPPELHYNSWVADRTIAFLEVQARTDQAQPFYLHCSFPDPHHPYCPPRAWADRYDPATMPPVTRRDGELDDLPPFYRRTYEQGMPLSGRGRATKIRDDQLRDIQALTCAMVSFVDKQFGRVLATLERLGLRENTVIVFTSDHGDMLGDHWMLNKGPFHFDGLLRVPQIWSWPGHFPSAATSEALVSLLDFVPTILELAAVPPLEGTIPPRRETAQELPPLPGVSLLPVLRGERTSVQDSVIIENDEDYLGLRLRTIVTDRFHMTVYPGQLYGELFDRQADPQQLCNRWPDPALTAVKATLTSELLHRLALTDSRLPRRLCHA
jgi:arylsulfatase A-like enzyme